MLKYKRRFLRIFISSLMSLFTRIEVEGIERLREIKGKAIIVSNHLGRLDGGFAFYLVRRDDMVITIAKKYREIAIYRWFGDQLDLLWLDRYEADLGTIREVLKRLAKGAILLMTPEGTRSKTEALLEGKPGVAYLASKSGANIVPLALLESEDRLVRASFKKFKRPRVKIFIGEPFSIPPLPKTDRSKFLEEQTDIIMTRIAALLPESHWGYYAGHPRLAELLKTSG